ncbi:MULTISPECIES: DUF5996 family protein [Bradyrhizobium]|jgi:uncharacterized protein DUF5996|uniref:DUF5996 family protein n=1 Tax=Bradyrhizobium TaxID=374 RepID=UPI00048011B5|nr:MULTISPECIES: DUF5996 family protein [Bradyrhizobium]MCS3450198.1 hypothetical protein [Bradyrhizobium elkanii]MCS3558658.1 hypothetical protein [Bradyrhizobium elkanii]MCW2151495.1 hypothetical protein [Bradyrhizobium elkanii]MCW2358632.1 hypothetical protein [Bradyrhizobium elkanii]MCW2375226.1 hypothetical protein [Bradyrhizobium elkanii]
MIAGKRTSDFWPALSSPAFEPTRTLLHMTLQAVGKLKLAEPFQAQWAEVPLWLSARGLTTGPIRYASGAYEIRADFISHELQWLTSSGASGQLPLRPTSVAALVDALLDQLRHAGIDASITLLPQEVSHPIPFNEDKEQRPYDRDLVNAWWRILLSTQRVMHEFQGRFTGKTQPIGLMWGTLDIRAVFYNGKPVTPAQDIGFIRRNAMDAELIEMGWWSGDASYPRPAFYSFTYPQPKGIENTKVGPAAARWDAGMGEFLLDYDDLRQSGDPESDLLTFLESTYHAGATAAGWDSGLLGGGRPE